MLRGSPHLIITLCCLGNPSPHPLLVLFAIYRCRVNKKFTTNKFGCGGHFFCVKWVDPKTVFQDEQKMKKRNHDLALPGCWLPVGNAMQNEVANFPPSRQGPRKYFLASILELMIKCGWENLESKFYSGNTNYTMSQYSTSNAKVGYFM